MSRVLTTTVGSYPRVGDDPAVNELRRVLDRWERGRATEADVAAAQERATSRALADQEGAGIDIVTDGHMRWYCPISHIAGLLGGARIDGLVRYFDTNFYVRQPVVQGPLARPRPLVVAEYRFAAAHTTRPVKPVLTGPYTLAAHSLTDGGPYGTLAALTLAYAAVLADEVADLAVAGAQHIQIDEPSLLATPADLPLVAEALHLIADRKGNARLWLMTYFGDAAPLYDALTRLPVDVLGLDFTYSARLAECVANAGTPRGCAFGLLNGRNTRLEDVDATARLLARLLPRVRGSAYLSPSCGLEYLPRDRAQQKLRLLAAVSARVDGSRVRETGA